MSELPAAEIAALLQRTLVQVDAAAGTLRARYVGRDTFTNPAGHVAGGMLSAMLDDLTAILVDSLTPPDTGLATLSLNVSFLRPALPGPIDGVATMVRQGRELCHVNGMLQQGGKDVAWAVAICKLAAR